jgi:hypothetical protein
VLFRKRRTVSASVDSVSVRCLRPSIRDRHLLHFDRHPTPTSWGGELDHAAAIVEIFVSKELRCSRGRTIPA